MATNSLGESSPVTPTQRDQEIALESSRKLSGLLQGKIATVVELRVRSGGNREESVSIPAAAVPLLETMLSEMAKGNALTVLPVHEEVTTQEAADLLNVSRPFLVRLLDEGKLPSRKVGTHRRVRLQDVLAYKRELFEDRSQALSELAAEAQKLDLGY